MVWAVRGGYGLRVLKLAFAECIDASGAAIQHTSAFERRELALGVRDKTLIWPWKTVIVIPCKYTLQKVYVTRFIIHK